ncbi:PaaI family thioesterase [Polycladidibacter stylochi]|uniref:PaaI family thioesterase n=1 Tax=Polycladidibacter stylochi TaxID=1807766 RepID=UPI000832945C|nr:PaaI family thioesterase [Pseudovibrio stylochi]
MLQSFNVEYDQYAQRIENSFAKQPFMKTLGAQLEEVNAGHVRVRLPRSEAILQQHGFFHGGVIATLADVAGGYAAYTLMPEGVGVLTAEFKINIVRPGTGEALIARGSVIKPGRTLTLAKADVLAEKQGNLTLVATGLFTMVGKEGLEG